MIMPPLKSEMSCAAWSSHWSISFCWLCLSRLSSSSLLLRGSSAIFWFLAIPNQKNCLPPTSHVSFSFHCLHWGRLPCCRLPSLRVKSLAGQQSPLPRIISALSLAQLLAHCLVSTILVNSDWPLACCLVLLERLHYSFQECATSDCVTCLYLN